MRRMLFSLAALGLAGLGAAAHADWLVTRDGARMETRGPWKVQGKLVVFTTAAGSLASVRAEQLDLAASQRATEEAKRPPQPAEAEAKPQEARKSVIAITDAEIAKVARPKPAEGEAAATPPSGQPGAGAARPAVSQPVVVANWQQQDLGDRTGLEVAGLLRNDGTDIATEVGITVSVFDDAGALVASKEGVLLTTTIEPHGTTRFRAPLPRIFTFAKVSFDVRSKGVRLQVEPEKPAN